MISKVNKVIAPVFKILLIIILILINSNILYGQGIGSNYKVSASCNIVHNRCNCSGPEPGKTDINLHSIEIKEVDSTNWILYDPSTIYYSRPEYVKVSVDEYSDCYGGGIDENSRLLNTNYFTQQSYSFGTACGFEIVYVTVSWYPPDVESITPEDSKINDGDNLTLDVSLYDDTFTTLIWERKLSTESKFTPCTLTQINDYQYEDRSLNNLNFEGNNTISVEYQAKVFHSPNPTEYEKSLYYCPSSPVKIYPKIPIITNIDGTPPVCNGESNGEITLTIDGEIDNPYVQEYEISVKEEGASFGTFHTTNSIFTINNISPLFDYDIIIRNKYIDSEANGENSYEDITIPNKQILNVIKLDEVAGYCHNVHNGYFKFQITGGNELYEVDVYEELRGYYKTYSNIKENEEKYIFAPPGNYQIIVKDKFTCEVSQDAELDYQVLEKAKLEASSVISREISCNGDSDGILEFDVQGGNPFPAQTPYYQYRLRNKYNTVVSSGNSDGNSIKVEGLPSSVYTLEITDDYNCPLTNIPAIQELINPKIVSSDIDTIDNNGFAIDCYGKSGLVTLEGNGGNGDYEYNVNNEGFKTNNIYSLVEGTHTVKVRDYKNCESDLINFELNAPEELELSMNELPGYNGYDIRCFGLTEPATFTGSGGIEAYKFKIRAEDEFEEINHFELYGNHNYTVYIQDLNQCESTINIYLTEPESLPEIDSLEETHIRCNNENNGIIKITPDPDTGVPGYEYSINGGIDYFSNDEFTDLHASVYYLMLRDTNNCESENSIPVNIINPPVVNLDWEIDTTQTSLFHISCYGENDGAVDLFGMGGTGLKIINFDSEDILGNRVEDLSAGTYFAFAKDSNNCTSDTFEIELIQPEPISFLDSYNDYNGYPIRCYDEHGTVNIIPEGGFGAKFTSGLYNVFLEFGADSNLNILNGIIPGDTIAVFDTLVAERSYDIRIQDANGCETLFTAAVVLTQPPQLTELYFDTDSTLCYGTNDGKVNARFEGGIPFTSNSYNYYLYDASNGLYIDTLGQINDTAQFTGLSFGDYFVTVEDTNNCLSSSNTETVFSPTQVDIDYTEQNPSCFGFTDGTLDVNASGGTSVEGEYDFALFLNEIDSMGVSDMNSYFFNNINAGTHFIRAYDDHTCFSTNFFTLTEPDELTVTINSTNITQEGASDGTAIANPEGGTTELNMYNYLWKDSLGNELSIEQNISNLESGWYYLDVWDDHNCPYGDPFNGLKDSVQIYEPGALILSVDSIKHESYPGAKDGYIKISAQGGWPDNYQFRLENGNYSPSNIFQNLPAGSYSIEAYDNFARSVIKVQILQIPSMQIENAQIHNVSCYGLNDGEISLTVSGGTPPYSYSSNGIVYQNENIFSELAPKNYTFYIKDSNGYQISHGTSISEPDILTVDLISTSDTDCGSEDGTASVEAEGGTTPYIFDWYSKGTHIGQYESTAEDLAAGIYTAEVTDANSCSDEIIVVINNPEGPQIANINKADASCYNTSDAWAEVELSSGTAPFTISWDDPNNQQTLLASNLAAGTYNVEIIDANNCMVSESVTVHAPDNVSVSFDITDPVCHNGCDGNIETEMSGGTFPYSIQWLNVDGQPTSENLTDICGGSYTLKVVDDHLCEYFAEAVIMNPEEINILEDEGATICLGQTKTLDAGNPGSNYFWTSDNGFQSSDQIITVDEAGIYTINIVNPEGCEAADQFSLDFNDQQFEVNFLMQSEAFVGDTVVVVEISWEMPDSYAWNIPSAFFVLNDSEENLQLIPTVPGTFNIGMNAFLGECFDYMEKQIIVYGSGEKEFVEELIKEESKEIKHVKLYPNPTGGHIQLDIELYKEADLQVEIYDIMGQRQNVHKQGKNSDQYQFEFNLNHLTDGIYFITIRTENGMNSVRFIKSSY